jgi:hypothetical protein
MPNTKAMGNKARKKWERLNVMLSSASGFAEAFLLSVDSVDTLLAASLFKIFVSKVVY